MHTSFSDTDCGARNSYSVWLGSLREMFPVKDEFLLADSIYPFVEDFHGGFSPAESYERFDAFVSAEAE